MGKKHREVVDHDKNGKPIYKLIEAHTKEDLGKPGNPRYVYNVKCLATATLMQKLAKQHPTWSVEEMAVDKENKRFQFKIVVMTPQEVDAASKSELGAFSSAEKSMSSGYEFISFEKACELMGWKSFKFKMNDQLVVPVLLPVYDEVEEAA